MKDRPIQEQLRQLSSQVTQLQLQLSGENEKARQVINRVKYLIGHFDAKKGVYR
jgi:hypothetical protein